MKIITNMVRRWVEVKKLEFAQRLIQSQGLSIVKLATKGNTTYFVNPDGTFFKLTKGGKK